MNNNLEEYIIAIVTDQMRLQGQSPENAARNDPKLWVGFGIGCLAAGAVFVGVLGLALAGFLGEDQY